jgi:asparagine synthetase A
MKEELREFGGVDEVEKVWNKVVEEEDWESVVKMGDLLLGYYKDKVEKMRELGKRYRDKKIEKEKMLEMYIKKFGKLE